MEIDRSSLYRLLPSVTEVDYYLEKQSLPSGKPVRHHVHETLQKLREQISLLPPISEAGKEFAFSDKSQILKYVAQTIAKQNTSEFRKVINGTGVVIHTNLGRAPLSKKLVESILPLFWSYSNLEYDLKTGQRGVRGSGIKDYLKLLSGAEDALAVNNNAAAVYLMLITLASGKEVIVSRGELIEIGGSFRIPDIMKAAGAKLIEVGTTNRTRLGDYKEAITENTVALMKVHPSNYTIRGFTEDTSMAEIAELAKKHGKWSFYDLGSGNFYRFQQPTLRHMPTVQQEVKSGADLVTFSGDKLLGSTQAGVVVGRKELIKRLAKHPLYRAFRLDKITMALLETHLAAYFDIETVADNIPVIGLLEQTSEQIREKAETVFQQINRSDGDAWSIDICSGSSLTGGGVLPEIYLDSYLLCFSHVSLTAEQIQTFFREQEPPIIARIQNEKVCLDFRTIFPSDFSHVITAIHNLYELS